MSAAAAGADEAGDRVTLRFAAAVTAAFVLSEYMQWAPTFMGAVLAAALLAKLPMRPPLKVGIALVLTMAAAALYAYALSALLRGTPTVLCGAIGLSMFLAFHSMLSGRNPLPAVLLLICLVTIPVVVMLAPAQASVFPRALIGGMALAILMVWGAFAIWPAVPAPGAAKAAPATPDPDRALVLALLSTAVVLPLMLVHLLFGLADALTVLVATVTLVINFDPSRSAKHSVALIVANFAGGMLGVLLHTVLITTPSLPFLALLLFLVLLGFGRRIAAGGPAAAVVAVACNAMLIILSSAIASGTDSFSAWFTRLFQLALAGVFAVSVMKLLWHRAALRRTARHESATA